MGLLERKKEEEKSLNIPPEEWRGGVGEGGRRSAIVPAVGIVTPVPGKWVSLRKQPDCPTRGVVWVWVGVSVEGVLYFGIIKHESDNGIKMVERVTDPLHSLSSKALVQIQATESTL